MDAEVRRANGALKGVSHERRLAIDVAGPTQPNLDLLDLPGLVAGARGSEPGDLPQQTARLVEANLRRLGDRALIALCHGAAQPFNQSLALRLVQGVPGREDRTFGVLTMLDKVDPEDLAGVVDRVLQLEAADAVRLESCGFVATALRKPAGAAAMGALSSYSDSCLRQCHRLTCSVKSARRTDRDAKGA